MTDEVRELGCQARGSGWDYTLEVPEDLRWFEGHFPGTPVLPAVVQLRDLVLPRVRAHWPALSDPARITKLKFRSIITPGQVLALRLEGDPDRRRARFEIHAGDTFCSSGTLWFR